jgi:hypothetical protein
MRYMNADLELQMINQAHEGLRCEAASARLASNRTAGPDRFTGLHFHLGRTLIVIGRTIREEDARRLAHLS